MFFVAQRANLTDAYLRSTLKVAIATKEVPMDATRSRRTRDAARQRWYASCRSRRFAKLLGFQSQNDNRPKK